MDINDRINEIIQQENLSIAAFARKIGIADQTVRSVCVLKRNKPGYDFIVNLVQTFEWINPYWLLTGDGDMKTGQSSNQGTPEREISLKELVDYLREKDKRIEELITERTELRMRMQMQENR